MLWNADSTTIFFDVFGLRIDYVKQQYFYDYCGHHLGVGCFGFMNLVPSSSYY